MMFASNKESSSARKTGTDTKPQATVLTEIVQTPTQKSYYFNIL